MIKTRALSTGAVALAVAVWVIGSSAGTARAEEAKDTYQKLCASCHGPAGKGDGPAGKMLKPPPPDMSATSTSDADLAKIIKEGGKAVGRSPLMPAYGAKLSDDQIKALVDLLKGFAAK